ncbi:MAG: hypothetical protein CUN53_18405, partial [Phototrophicales bacterium]
MAAITQSQLEKPASWRDNLKITRSGVIAVLFVLLGIWMVTGAISMDTATQTRLTFGSGVPDVTVSTQPYTLIVGILYALIGAISLIGIGGKRARTLTLYGGGILLIPTVLIVAAANNSINVTVMLQVSLRLSTPIVMGALAGIWCERAGVVNIAIEGMMLTGACFGFTVFTLLLG